MSSTATNENPDQGQNEAATGNGDDAQQSHDGSQNDLYSARQKKSSLHFQIAVVKEESLVFRSISLSLFN